MPLGIRKDKRGIRETAEHRTSTCFYWDDFSTVRQGCELDALKKSEKPWGT
jgi:hypothetical protein